MDDNCNNILMSDKIDSLAIALSKAQVAIENVKKNKQAYNYKYADLANCLQAIKKPLATNGLSVSQLITQNKENKQALITLLMHESGQWLKSTLEIETVLMKQCNSLQQLGAGITFARRYTLCAIVGLSQEDDDGNSVPKFKKEIEDNKDLIDQFISLCNVNKVDTKEFAKFHKIDSQDANAIKYGIENFAILKEQYINEKNANT